MTDMNIVPFGRGVQLLRGWGAEEERLARISLRRRAAYRRAVEGDYAPDDQAMFGPRERMLEIGPADLPSTPPLAPKVG